MLTLPRPSARSDAGLTLIEMAVVLVIIGLATGGVMVGFDRMLPESRVRGVAREFGAVLRQGRTAAWTQGREHWVEVDLANSRLRLVSPIEKDSDPPRLAGRPEDRTFFPWYELEEQVGLEVWLPDGTKIRPPSPWTVRFDPRGTFPFHYVVLADRSVDPDDQRTWTYYTLEVHGLTGSLEFYEGLPQIDVPTESDFFS